MGRAARYAVSAVVFLAIAVGGYLGIAALHDALYAPKPVAQRAVVAPAAVVEAKPAAAAAVIAAAPAANVPAAKGPAALCMSDVEVDAYLKHAAFGPIAFGAARCSEKFPDLKEEADTDIAALQKAHGAMLGTVAAASLPPYTRSFAADGVKRRDTQLDVDRKPVLQRIQSYSRDECKSHLAAIEGFAELSDAEFDAVLGNIARQSYDAKREAVPSCG